MKSDCSFRPHSHRSSHSAPPCEPKPTSGQTPATAPKVVYTLIRYSPEQLRSHETLAAIPERPEPAEKETTWLHIQHTPDPAQLQTLGKNFGLHPLALKDILHHRTRTKIQTFDDHQFLSLIRLLKKSDGSLAEIPVFLFLGTDFVISIDSGPASPFDPIVHHLNNRGPILGYAADYLLYALIDAVVDSGFLLLEGLGNKLESLENKTLANPDKDARIRIHRVKRQLMQMRHAWWPQREVLAIVMRDDDHRLTKHTRLYLRDCYDHSVILVDFVETYREMASNLLDIYLSAASQRMNDIMKALTIIATIFLPLTFLTSLYGMNFDTASRWNMPELHWKYGYPAILLLMLLISGGMLWYFKRKRWL